MRGGQGTRRRGARASTVGIRGSSAAGPAPEGRAAVPAPAHGTIPQHPRKRTLTATGDCTATRKAGQKGTAVAENRSERTEREQKERGGTHGAGRRAWLAVSPGRAPLRSAPRQQWAGAPQAPAGCAAPAAMTSGRGKPSEPPAPRNPSRPARPFSGWGGGDGTNANGQPLLHR